ncbi:MAG TPA: hypothetical protein PK453_09770 [Leptospiraceae bacterium]|nr:hypothetical protein [Leptospiraceae bacterium]HNF13947.1 hypothetical protein [Leptospiraceae bacterium]HNH08855.1 hypothetical protein [Leptospiraceae bacterium]HNI28232.1 hypothetical protein [Leptospiraceae bacterium]HNM02096.1 hypothetical protein [Leptospiraceae bacterium]
MFAMRKRRFFISGKKIKFLAFLCLFSFLSFTDNGLKSIGGSSSALKPMIRLSSVPVHRQSSELLENTSVTSESFLSEETEDDFEIIAFFLSENISYSILPSSMRYARGGMEYQKISLHYTYTDLPPPAKV